MEYFCLWRATYSDESAQAILYHFPGPQASLHPPSPQPPPPPPNPPNPPQPPPPPHFTDMSSPGG